MASTTSEGEQGEKLGVVVSNLTNLMYELVENLISQQPDMRLLGQVNDNLTLLSAGAEADLVIMGAPTLEPLPSICTHLLSEYPDLKILVLTPSGEMATLYWMGLRRRHLRRLTATSLIRSLRLAGELNPVS